MHVGKMNPFFLLRVNANSTLSSSKPAFHGVAVVIFLYSQLDILKEIEHPPHKKNPLPPLP